ncbi:MAG: hypothetical protein ABW098_18915, partial [Candidatus Thiodiazotropha sp.]
NISSYYTTTLTEYVNKYLKKGQGHFTPWIQGHWDSMFMKQKGQPRPNIIWRLCGQGLGHMIKMATLFMYDLKEKKL